MQTQVGSQNYSFYSTLRQWGTKGVPVNCGPDWDWIVIEQSVARGPHRSLMDTEHEATVKEDIQYQVEAGFSQIIPWEEVHKLKPKDMKVSPMTEIPQNNRGGESY